MKNFIVLASIVLSMNAMATETADESTPPAAEVYTMFCGSLEDIQAYAKSKGYENVSSAELAEMKKSRSLITQLLQDPAPTMKSILDQGNKSDTGAFGLIITCGAITQMKDLILEKGCTDLETNKKVQDKGGIKACEDLMAQFPK